MPIVIHGLKELRAELKTVSAKAPREIGRALKDGAKEVTARAVELAPKDKGGLASSGRPFSTARAAGVRFTAPYASVQEFAVTWHRRQRGSGMSGSGTGGRLTSSQKTTVLRSGGAGLQAVHYSKDGPPPRFANKAVNELGPGLIDESFERLCKILEANGWFR